MDRVLKTQALQWVAPGELNLLGFEEGTLEPRSPRFVQRLLRLESGEREGRCLEGGKKHGEASEAARASERGVARSGQRCSAATARVLRKALHTAATRSTGSQGINDTARADITHLGENLSLSALPF